jgi:hypothetical protein
VRAATSAAAADNDDRPTDDDEDDDEDDDDDDDDDGVGVGVGGSERARAQCNAFGKIGCKGHVQPARPPARPLHDGDARVRRAVMMELRTFWKTPLRRVGCVCVWFFFPSQRGVRRESERWWEISRIASGGAAWISISRRRHRRRQTLHQRAPALDAHAAAAVAPAARRRCDARARTDVARRRRACALVQHERGERGSRHDGLGASVP